MAKKKEEVTEEVVENVEETVEADTTIEEEAKVEKKAKKTTAKAADTKSKKNKLRGSEKKHAKKYRDVVGLIEKDRNYTAEEAVELAKKTSITKFDSSVEVHISLGIDVRKADQQVRGSVVLPNGTGKTKKVCAIVGAAKEKEAKDAGADFVGGAELIEKIVKKGWVDFDVMVATPDMMSVLGKAAKILGPKKLMPNPKVGTVTNDIEKTVKNLKTGMIEYRADSFGIVHQAIGRTSFDSKKIIENYDVLIDVVKKAKPSASKGTYVKSVYITTTMGPSIKVAV